MWEHYLERGFSEFENDEERRKSTQKKELVRKPWSESEYSSDEEEPPRSSKKKPGSKNKHNDIHLREKSLMGLKSDDIVWTHIMLRYNVFPRYSFDEKLKRPPGN